MFALVGVNEFKWAKICCNPRLGFMTKAKACKSVGQKGGPGDTSCTPESARKYERMNPHTPNATPSWGVKVPMDS